MKPSLLTIDIGNTHQSVAAFVGDDIVEKRNLIDLEDWIHFDGPVIVSKVGPDLPLPFPHIKSVNDFRKENKILDMKISYAQTLGEDRIAFAYYAFKKILSEKINSIMTIDAGTFTTIDFITKDGFQGGHIFPGPKTLSEIYRRGKQLTQHSPDYDHQNEIPQTTEQAISRSLSLMIEKPIQTLIESWSPDLILITGGASKLLPLLPNSQFIENGLHKGLKALHDAQAK